MSKHLKPSLVCLYLVLTISVSLPAKAQTNRNPTAVTMNVKNASLSYIIRQITKLTGIIIYFQDEDLNTFTHVTVQVQNKPISDLFHELLDSRGLAWTDVSTNVIAIRKNQQTDKQPISPSDTSFNISGHVTDVNNNALIGASVAIKGSGRGAITDLNGRFSIRGARPDDKLIVTYTGYLTKEIFLGGNKTINITLSIAENKLDETVVIAYGTTTQRVNTGTVAKVKAEEIETQPVSNPLAALEGRVSGMVITQSNGNAGGAVNIQIRGNNSISQGSAPLFLIDGVPFSNSYAGAQEVTLLSANGGQSPFASINPADIESIEILKDADATAIYGSRGANGVVLITTKKGHAGRTKVDANIYSGIGHVTNMIKMLNTPQYLQMRREAYKNDGLTPSGAAARDLLLWDTTRYTDWQKELIGNTSHITNGNITLSGGNENTQFLIGANYNHQTTVYPTSLADNRGGGYFNLTHRSGNNKFSASLNTSYTNDKNELPTLDLTNLIMLLPNNPSLYDSLGRLSWSEKGGTFNNPLAYLVSKNKTVTNNLISSANLKYNIIPGLDLKVNGGFNFLQVNQLFTNPVKAQNPNLFPVASATFGNTSTTTWIIEPQLNYSFNINNSKIDFLLGSTIQKTLTDQSRILASGFPNDELITAAAFATSVTSYTNIIDYRYQAFFGRATYNLKGKYLVNLTARRDGSSRFGPGKQFNTFGALGLGWVFSEEQFIKNSLSFLSYGKIRGSYGITGNDQIGDYQYRDNYTNSYYPYQGESGYIPSRLFNSDYAWERNKKIEGALELGFIDNRILLNVNYYRNRSNNQLINYKLPAQTGFTDILKNFDATVQNTGWEFELSSTNIQHQAIRWSTSLNLTIPKNKLVAFPGLENSTYANTLVIGQPIGIVKTIDFKGVDPTTGIYEFNGTNIPNDQVKINNLAPRLYGGIINNISYKNFDLSFLFQLVVKDGYSYNQINPPGTRNNQPIEVLNRWQKKGDETNIQRYTITGSAFTAYVNFLQYSDGTIANASYVRLKNTYLSYSLPATLSKKIGIQMLKVYLQGQNLLTFTKYKGLDPETNTFVGSNSLPTMRVWSAGLQVSL
ncbi:SusC/RagA family TonB-linked outer membrane protein [Chitinophaga silvisoli]|uniref:TonB-dependent receptor n=1 Tax=Chitinophaga silvisoli TaxID=2291814 RepID=A0A3E1P3B8_9BACT|nr:TonB-dependent receptor [Chitinophaga silvisoli]RFM34679.1 TonB-dependent receptor [Chitinophaga silvisoli]